MAGSAAQGPYVQSGTHLYSATLMYYEHTHDYTHVRWDESRQSRTVTTVTCMSHGSHEPDSDESRREYAGYQRGAAAAAVAAPGKLLQPAGPPDGRVLATAWPAAAPLGAGPRVPVAPTPVTPTVTPVPLSPPLPAGAARRPPPAFSQPPPQAGRRASLAAATTLRRLRYCLRYYHCLGGTTGRRLRPSAAALHCRRPLQPPS